MIEAMACGTPVIGWSRGSVPEVIEDGVTGFVVESEAEAVAAIGRIRGLDRGHIRERFERRFTARRMAEEYVGSYRLLASMYQSQAATEAKRKRARKRSVAVPLVADSYEISTP
jgi:glycosyltransferase involved in cell wall biosynthesis